MWKILFAVLALILAALAGGVYFNFNPAIPIFAVLGAGIFLVGPSPAAARRNFRPAPM